MNEKKIVEASKFWPRGNNNGLPWPIRGAMFSEKNKILYIPIAKCGCTSIKKMMIDLSDVEHKDELSASDLHLITDQFNTGLQIKDVSTHHAINILSSSEYFRFAVVREPVERLVSAYLEKFVRNRFNAGNQGHTSPVVKAIRGDADHNSGVTFREFIQYICSQKTEDLDAHWIPQSMYLKPFDNDISIYRLEELDQLKSDLAAMSGSEISIPHSNKTKEKVSADVASLTGKNDVYVDYLPKDLDSVGDLSSRNFITDDVSSMLHDTYMEDSLIYKSTFNRGKYEQKNDEELRARKLYEYIESRTKPGSLKSTLRWMRVALISKGICKIIAGEKTPVQVWIDNQSGRTLKECASGGEVYIGFSLLDKNGSEVFRNVRKEPVDEEEFGEEMLKLEVPIFGPKDILKEAWTVQFSLLVKKQYWVSKLLPLHACWATILKD